MNDKRIIENYRSIRDVERLQPEPLKPEDIEFIKRMIDDGLNRANPKNRDTRSLAEIVSDIEADKSKSPARKSFEIRMAKMAHRLAHRKTVLSVSNDASQSDSVSEPLPLHEQIKFLREQKN